MKTKRAIKWVFRFIFMTVILVIGWPVHVLVYYFMDDDRTLRSAFRVVWKSYLWMITNDDDDRRWEEFHRAEMEMK